MNELSSIRRNTDALCRHLSDYVSGIGERLTGNWVAVDIMGAGSRVARLRLSPWSICFQPFYAIYYRLYICRPYRPIGLIAIPVGVIILPPEKPFDVKK